MGRQNNIFHDSECNCRTKDTLVTEQRSNIGNGRLSPAARQFLKLFLPGALLLGVLTAAFQYHGYALARESLLASQRHGIATATSSLRRDFQTMTADLGVLAASQSLRRFATETAAANRRWAQDELDAFIRHKQLYADISYFAPDGQRLLGAGSVQQGGRLTEIEPPLIWELLVATANLPPGLAATSPLLFPRVGDHYRPIVHFAMPVFTLDGQLGGALIATYSPERLLRHLDSLTQQPADTNIIINRRGEWLQHHNAEQSWRLGDGPFGAAFPLAWQHMLTADAGQFRTREGLFTFTTLFPQGWPDDVMPDGMHAPQFWKIALHVSRDSLLAAATNRFWRGLTLFVVLLAPTALVSQFICELDRNRQRNRQLIRELGAVIEQTHDLVMITDAEGRIRYVNPRFEAITGYSRAEAIGNKPNLLRSGVHDQAFYQRLWDTIRRGEPFEATITNRKKNGEIFHVQITISPLSGKHGISGYVATAKDITAQVSSQQRLLKLAFHHPLTGLPNRALFRDHLHEAAARARRSGHSIAVLFIDLDRFKKVNDSLGHQAGDELLQQVAQRLRNAVREIDTVAHLGGDEFTVLLDDVRQPSQVQNVASKLLQLFELPFTVAGRDLHIGASIGIALFPQDSDNVELIVEQADTAMYQAKRAGRNQFQFYSAEMTTLAHERLELEDRLRVALQRREFELHFQPIVDPQRRELRGLEALVRWRQSDGSLRPPDEFIPVLEETGLVIQATEWVLEEACRQHLRLLESGLTGLRINVNISARSFNQGDLVATVERTLRESGVPGTQLVLEVTESILLEDQQEVQKALDELRALGVAIAIDDFGTGYSSLAYLRRLPVDIIKIDRAFIHGVGPDSRDAALVSAMMAMAQELQLDVVAEGVETPQQLEFLRQRSCDGAQGFLFSAAVPADIVRDQLRQDRRWPWKAWMDRNMVRQLH